MCQHPHDHHDDGDKEDDDGDAVHAVHEEEVGIAGLALVALLEEEVLLDLVQDGALRGRGLWGVLLHGILKIQRTV